VVTVVEPPIVVGNDDLVASEEEEEEEGPEDEELIRRDIDEDEFDTLGRGSDPVSLTSVIDDWSVSMTRP
jgi:hypothetical protein